MSALTVTPDDSLVDEALTIRVDGLDPGQEVTLVAIRHGDTVYRGEATFEADADGIVDPATQAPVRGDYEGVRPMGLIQFAREQESGRRRSDGIEEGHRLRLSARAGGEVLDEETVVRRTLSPDVEQITIEAHDDELLGDLFLPPGEGPHPGVLLLSGSGGGIPRGVQAKLLASHGYAVLTLAYFQPSELGADTGGTDRPFDRVPEVLQGVELSYFDRAVTWLADHERVGAVGVHGGSRGSEPAVLTAARNDVVSAVVLVAPLAYAFCSFDSDAFGEPAWTVDGDEYPYLTNNFRFGRVGWMVRSLWLALTGGNMSYADSFRRAVEAATTQKREAAALPVEETSSALLFLSGGDDRLAPSECMSERLVERLDEHGHEHEYSHYSYPDAGHVIASPYTPVRGRDAGEPILGRMGLALGGTPAGAADADVDAWKCTLAFFDRTLATA